MNDDDHEAEHLADPSEPDASHIYLQVDELHIFMQPDEPVSVTEMRAHSVGISIRGAGYDSSRAPNPSSSRRPYNIHTTMPAAQAQALGEELIEVARRADAAET
jgi:hypothetical protein